MKLIKKNEYKEGYAEPFTEYKVGIIFLWTNNNNKILHAWGKDGTTLPSLNNKILNNNLIEALKTNEWQDTYECAECHKMLKEKKHYHFKGVYCDTCWEKYKKAHSGTCSLCGQPEYKCTC